MLKRKIILILIFLSDSISLTVITTFLTFITIKIVNSTIDKDIVYLYIMQNFDFLGFFAFNYFFIFFGLLFYQILMYFKFVIYSRNITYLFAISVFWIFFIQKWLGIAWSNPYKVAQVIPTLLSFLAFNLVDRKVKKLFNV